MWILCVISPPPPRILHLAIISIKMRFSFSSVACHLLNYRVPQKIIYWKYQHIFFYKKRAVDKMRCGCCTFDWTETLQSEWELAENSLLNCFSQHSFSIPVHALSPTHLSKGKSQPSRSSRSSSATSNLSTCKADTWIHISHSATSCR